MVAGARTHLSSRTSVLLTSPSTRWFCSTVSDRASACGRATCRGGVRLPPSAIGILRLAARVSGPQKQKPVWLCVLFIKRALNIIIFQCPDPLPLHRHTPPPRQAQARPQSSARTRSRSRVCAFNWRSCRRSGTWMRRCTSKWSPSSRSSMRCVRARGVEVCMWRGHRNSQRSK